MLARLGLVALLTVAGVATGAPPAAAARPCTGPSTLAAGGEFRAHTTRGEVWLSFGEVPPTVGQSLKIVWRVTGKGPLRVQFRDPSGRRRPLTFGPERHRASSFRHPGAEWGTGFAFDARGCWTVDVERVGAAATVGIRVT